MNLVKKILIEWVIAISISIAIVNNILLLTYHPAPWLDTDSNATHGLFAPGSIIVYGEEGYGIRKIDVNGYANPSNRLGNDSYILFMGSSHSVGKEIKQGRSFIDILEKEYGYDVYSIAMDGHYYPEIVSGFSAAVEQFPNANTIVIEIGSTDYTIDELTKSIDQRSFDNDKVALGLIDTLGTKGKVKLYYQNYLPIIRAISKNVKAGKTRQDVQNLLSDTTVPDGYEESILKTLKSMRQVYKGKVIIAYHPSVQLLDDGSLEIVDSNSKEIFKSCCEKYDIDFVDVGNNFISEYNSDNKLPYGFMNTAYGQGHLNETGHRIMADMINVVLEEKCND